MAFTALAHKDLFPGPRAAWTRANDRGKPRDFTLKFFRCRRLELPPMLGDQRADLLVMMQQELLHDFWRHCCRVNLPTIDRLQELQRRSGSTAEQGPCHTLEVVVKLPVTFQDAGRNRRIAVALK